MSSANISGRSIGCISIPIEIIPPSNSSFYSRPNPPLQTLRTNYSSSDFAHSPPRINSSFKSPTTAYDRSIKHSEFYDRPLSQEPSAFFSNEDLSKRSNIQLQNNPSRFESDFIHPNQSNNSFRHFPDYSQGEFSNSHDRSRSPASQRSESPTRPPPPQGTSQQESDFKISKDATNSSVPQSNDQQVPSTDTSVRDPNTIALEKLEQIKQSLADLHQQVDAFTGSTRADRTYKVLDEQAVKLMLRCDELLDVSADIKEKRKEMIQNVQTVVTKLESKVPSIDSNSNSTENTLVIYDSAINIPEQTST